MVRIVPLGHLDISENGKRYVNDAMSRNRLSRGYYTEQFEHEFAKLHDVKHAIFMNSGTSALQVALAALKERYSYADGDEVLVPATTFIASSNVIIQNNLKPVFVDVGPLTYNMDSAGMMREKITQRTRAIMPVHLLGLPANAMSTQCVAAEYGLQVIEDSCETMFARDHGVSVGNIGDIACFSTYVNHIIVGGVGGIVTTSNDKLAELCRSLMAHGRDSVYTNIDADDGLSGSRLKNIMQRRFKFERVGYSFRATELEAAIALSELENWKENIETRRLNAAYLTLLLHGLQDKLQLPTIPLNREHSFMMYPLVLIDDKIDRDDLLLFMEEKGIETRYLFPLLNQPVYRRLFPGQERNFPIARMLGDRGFLIGIHQGLNFHDIEHVANTIKEYFA